MLPKPGNAIKGLKWHLPLRAAFALVQKTKPDEDVAQRRTVGPCSPVRGQRGDAGIPRAGSEGLCRYSCSAGSTSLLAGAEPGILHDKEIKFLPQGSRIVASNIKWML